MQLIFLFNISYPPPLLSVYTQEKFQNCISRGALESLVDDIFNFLLAKMYYIIKPRVVGFIPRTNFTRT